MKLFEKLLEEILAESLKNSYPHFKWRDNLYIQKTNSEEFGDYQTNFAMVNARDFKMAPRALAEDIVRRTGSNEVFKKIEAAGPGFINIFINDDYIGKTVGKIGEEAYDFSFLDRKGDIIIDYSSPNIAKRMHIGHLRSTVIGDSLKRIFRFLGYSVIGDNHVGDWGTQFGKLIVGYRKWLDKEAYAENPVEELERIYVKFEKLSENDLSLIESARKELKDLQDGKEESKRLWQEFVDVSLLEYEKIYKRIGVEFDTFYGESFYNDMMPSVILELKDKGLAVRSEEALVVFFDKNENIPVCIVQKKDGAYLYATSDLACLRYRHENYDLNRVIYVTDDRQITHFRQVFRIADMLGWNIKKEHVWFGVMRFPEGIFSSRKGNVIRLEDLLNEAKKRILAIIAEKNPDLPPEEMETASEVIGIASVKYFDLSQNRTSTLIFDWDKTLNFDGNTAPYLLYTYARIRSILRKASEMNKSVDSSAVILFTEKIERTLAVKLTRFPNVVLKSAENYTPNFIADYLFELAQNFNTFYNSLQVLKVREEIMKSRLLLAERTSRIIKSGLDLLGIKTLERM